MTFWMGKRDLTAQSHAPCNQIAVTLSYRAGLRVGEIAALKVEDVFNSDGNVRKTLETTPAESQNRVMMGVCGTGYRGMGGEIRAALAGLTAISRD